MPIMPDHAQARRCRIGIDLLPKLLGTADPWSDKESQSDYWLGSARSTPDELTRGKQQKIRLLFGHEYRYSWTSIITSKSCPFCIAWQHNGSTYSPTTRQQWHIHNNDMIQKVHACKRQIHDSRQETAGGTKSSQQVQVEPGQAERRKFPRGGNLIKKSRVYRNEARPPGCQSRCLRQLSWGLFSWHPFLLAILCAPPLFGCLPPGISLSLDILSRDASTFSWSGLPLTSLALGGLTHFFLLTTFVWFHRRLLTFLSFGTVLLTLLALHIPFQLTSVSPDIFVPCSLEILLSWKKQVLFGASFLDPHFPGPPSLDIPFLLSRCFPRGSFYTQMLLRSFTFKNLDSQKGFTQRSLYAQELLRTDVFAQRNFYTRELVHAKDLRTRRAFTRRSFYAQATFTHRKLLHVESFRTQKLVHKVALAHSKLLLVHAEVFPRWKLLRKRFYRGFLRTESSYTQVLLHADTHTNRHTQSFYIQKLLHRERLHTEAFTHTESSYTQKLLCTQRSYTQMFLHTDNVYAEKASTQRKLLHTEALTHRRSFTRKAFTSPSEASTQISFYTVTGTFTCRCFYTEDLVQTNACTQEAFTQRRFYTEKLLHAEACTHRRFYRRKLLTTEIAAPKPESRHQKQKKARFWSRL